MGLNPIETDETSAGSLNTLTTNKDGNGYSVSNQIIYPLLTGDDTVDNSAMKGKIPLNPEEKEFIPQKIDTIHGSSS